MTDSNEVRLPRQLMEQNDKAEQMLSGKSEDVPVVQDPQVVVEQKTEENPIQVQEPQVMENTQQQQAVELSEQAPKIEQAPQGSEMDELAKTWKEKYLVLQGKYNAEIPRLMADLKQMREEISYLKSHKEETKPKLEEKIDIRKIVPKETIDAYGEDLLNATVNASYEANKSKIEKTEQELERLRGEVSNMVARSFEAQVKSQIPDFDEINTNPKFISWLDNLGITPVLQNAGYNGDAKTVVNIFNQWKSLNPTAKPQVSNVSPARKEERYISPAKTNAPVQVTQEKKKWTAAEVSKVMTDIARGRYDYEDMKKLNIEIDSAIAEGRISP